MDWKFSELEYTRPDIESVEQGIREYTAALKSAGSFEETWELLLGHKNAMMEYNTMRNMASIRNTVDTRDPFYAEEKRFFSANAPKLALLVKEANEALLTSPFRPQLEEKLGSLFFTIGILNFCLCNSRFIFRDFCCSFFQLLLLLSNFSPSGLNLGFSTCKLLWNTI